MPANPIYVAARILRFPGGGAARVSEVMSQTASVSVRYRWPVASDKRLILVRLWTLDKNSEVHDQSNETLLEGDEVCGSRW